MVYELRKVKFYIDRFSSFDYAPDLVESEGERGLPCELDGYFHCWVKEERKSPQSDLFREETVALVEEESTGKMYHVDYDLLRFLK